MGCGASTDGSGMTGRNSPGGTDSPRKLRLLQAERYHELKPTSTALSVDSLPPAAAAGIRHAGGSVRVHKSTYQANAPSEDRSTVVMGKDFIFCGVWDGHGGTPCSEHIESHAFDHFAASKAAGNDNETVWREMYGNLDAGFFAECMEPFRSAVAAGGEGAPVMKYPKGIFAGACCTGCFVDLRNGLHCPADQFEMLIHSASGLDMDPLLDLLRVKKNRKRGRRGSIERISNTLNTMKASVMGLSDLEGQLFCQVRVNGTIVGRSPGRPGPNPQWHCSVKLHGMNETDQNTIRVELMMQDECVASVDFSGKGIGAFDKALKKLSGFPVLLDDDMGDGSSGSCGKLFCQVQAGVNIGVGNLGDSRAVMGKYRGGQLRTVPLSEDHAVTNDAECERMMEEQGPFLPQRSADGLSNLGGETDIIDSKTERVKGICAFTRSIGDFQMKDREAAEIWNRNKKLKIYPVPGEVLPEPGAILREDGLALTPGGAAAETAVEEPLSSGALRTGSYSTEMRARSGADGGLTEVGDIEDELSPPAAAVPPFISCISEYQAEKVVDGFVIIGCDGVWDEMSSGEAVQIVSELLANAESSTASGKDAPNLADLFIDRVLEKVVARLRRTFKDEATLTLQELKDRPAGKGFVSPGKYRRSCLHDDITVIVLHFTSTEGRQAQADVASGLANDKRTPAALAAEEAFESLVEDGLNERIEKARAASVRPSPLRSGGSIKDVRKLQRSGTMQVIQSPPAPNGGVAGAARESHNLDVDSPAAAAAAAGARTRARTILNDEDARTRSRTILNDDEPPSSPKLTVTSTAPAEGSSPGRSYGIKRSSSAASTAPKLTVTLAESGLPDLTQPNTVQSLTMRMGGGIVSTEDAASFADILATAGQKQSAEFTLHVRGVGWANGSLEKPGGLEALFGQYGEVSQVVVRHREDAETGENTSWALVYMPDEESCNKALMGTTVHPETGDEMDINKFSKKTAAASKGGMVQVLQLAEFERWVEERGRQRSIKKWGGDVRTESHDEHSDDIE